MVRANFSKFISAGKKYIEYSGLSTDTKPTSGCVTGSLFHEVDTGDVYAFDETTKTWYKNAELGGEG